MICYPNVKINLGLKVLRKREDGYHDLETLFLPYPGIADCLEIITGDDYSRTLSGLREQYPSLTQAISEDGKLMITLARREGVDWDPLKDLTAKAYFLLNAQYDLPPMKIYLEKRSPVGAGLGGGSSDAAFALRMISTLVNLELSDEQLASYAAQLGSDCAFFIYNRPMFGSGRGEILEPFELDLTGYRVEVFIPEGIAVSTADAYRGIVPHEPEVPLKEILRRPVSSWKDCLDNDFEQTVFAKYPALAEVKEELYKKGAIYAAMSGSGSAFFGIFKG
ncbi:MAG: 4-(cytidine 5'-diphospho)-2-C-methyl-D-erythritol kinase [Bacteroidales bacterium]|jgi:4-diphosphocytidyl-2-C-methyl-D-erythritol kinase|nr:4-(cytidine 5'-diphospho)-2-C-methyl-D-erythritol kinase [Bacteroidales bacterium]